MKKRKIKSLMLVKASVANLNSAKHEVKGGNSFDVLCNHTDFLSDCNPEECPGSYTCPPPPTQGCTNTGCNPGTLDCHSKFVLCEP
ncbi:hypothetical protein [Ascidiimonas aurantiaca]|uniref:hypothetical protein n=1 Tax=Ascidiimonas aurantiaca TaxID=1685432 RepID=UPI0030EC7501